MDIANRERKINIENMAPEQIDELSKRLGDKIREICDKAVEESNKLLNIYGMNAKMMVTIESLNEKQKGQQS